MLTHQTILLATKHQKERAIAPVFESAFNCRVVPAANFDTDQFGTFSGEIPRSRTALETLQLKARTAADKFKQRFVIASEGSFGPHPNFFLTTANTELMAFYDAELDLMIIESLLSTNTNYAQLELTPDKKYADFLDAVGFPNHGLMLVSTEPRPSFLRKGITDLVSLERALASGFEHYPKLRIETDMRAMMNPKRMQVIAELAKKLADRLKNICPRCHCYGFGDVRAHGKLHCADCDSETELFAERRIYCPNCHYYESHARPDHKTLAEPQFCPFCNP